MRLGIIDLGTNSIRFDAYEMRKKKPQLLYRERLMVRLGEGVFINGHMAKDAIDRTIEAFISFRYTADQLGVSKIVAVATSAARQASDRQRLVTIIKKKCGIDVRIISGEEEAGFIARGILGREKNISPRLALVDIGGGSIEISLFKKGQTAWASSLALGTARIEQLFRLNEPGLSVPKRVKRVKELRKYIRNVLSEHSQNNPWGKVGGLIGSSGTIKALVRLQQSDSKNKKLTGAFLKTLIRKLVKLNRAEILKIPRMDPTRIDMILGGAIALDEIMNKFGISNLKLTEFALREGILDEETDLIRDRKDTPLAHHLSDLKKRLNSSLTNSEYAQKIVSLTEELFDSLQSVHKLGRKWKAYLSAAAMLQNTGKVISPVGHHRHSFYIVSNLDFPWLDRQDRSILSHLCLWHSDGKIEAKDLSFIETSELRSAFLKALAILRIANALVWYEQARVRVLKSYLTRGQVHLRVAAGGTPKLLSLRVEARSKLFSKVFKRKLILNPT